MTSVGGLSTSAPEARQLESLLASASDQIIAVRDSLVRLAAGGASVPLNELTSGYDIRRVQGNAAVFPWDESSFPDEQTFQAFVSFMGLLDRDVTVHGEAVAGFLVKLLASIGNYIAAEHADLASLGGATPAAH